LEVSFYGLFISFFALVILLAVISRQHYKITSLWSPVGILLIVLLCFIGITEVLIAVGFVLRFIEDKENRKESARKIIILKFKRCLFILEQAQLRANNTAQEVIPIASTKPRPQFGSAKGLIQMSDDFDAPLTDFDEYMP